MNNFTPYDKYHRTTCKSGKTCPISVTHASITICRSFYSAHAAQILTEDRTTSQLAGHWLSTPETYLEPTWDYTWNVWHDVMLWLITVHCACPASGTRKARKRRLTRSQSKIVTDKTTHKQHNNYIVTNHQHRKDDALGTTRLLSYAAHCCYWNQAPCKWVHRIFDGIWRSHLLPAERASCVAHDMLGTKAMRILWCRDDLWWESSFGSLDRGR